MEILRIVVTVLFAIDALVLAVIVLMQEGKSAGLTGTISGMADTYWGKNKGRSIEGGLEKKPDNILIYATSNRRHLIKESFRDNEELHGDLHSNDTIQEKLSLVSRFGVTIYFGSPDKKEFQQIVRTLAERNGIDMPEEQLLLEANKWELSHGGLSGRTAQQFVDYVLGTA